MALEYKCIENCSYDPTRYFYEMINADNGNDRANGGFGWNLELELFIYQPWFLSVVGSFMIGLAGVFPLLVIPIEEGANLKNGAGAGTLKVLLSFAVGGLLGDVFLHLLPEAWESQTLEEVRNGGSKHPSMYCGLWVLAGFLVFVITEKIFAFERDESESNEDELVVENDDVDKKTDREKIALSLCNNNVHKELDNNNCVSLNGDHARTNGFRAAKKEKESLRSYDKCEVDRILKNACFHHRSGPRRNGYSKNGYTTQNGFPAIDKAASSETTGKREKAKHISGYLNLIANCIDNFTHGLAVGGGFLVSLRLGVFTTFAILIHEIPHEVGDFAILLKSGFTRWEAARAQLLTATGGMIGALVAVVSSGIGGIESRTSWIMPFSAGGFLHIALVTVLPELLKETNTKESMKQLAALFIGILLMGVLTILCE